MVESVRINWILKQPEGLRLEFKKAKSGIPDSVFDTICAMLNRDGGDIFLGIDDSGKVMGIDPKQVQIMVQSLIDSTNNSQKLNPPFLLQPLVHNINGLIVLHLQVPASSQVHRTNKGIFDRSNEGDYLVREPFLISELYNRKRNYYTEGIIFNQAGMEDLDDQLFNYAKILIRSNNPNHPWLKLNNLELLKISGLYRKDLQSGIEGISLAAILLFGKDETISSVIPQYKTDLLLRKSDMERYDDRELIQTNLLVAYDQAIAFINKYLPDKPYYENTQRISLRANIFRELIGNLLIHREYTNALPARLIIYKNRLETINAHVRHGNGAILISNYTPFPKNPLISKFFIQLGRAEELGSGIIRISKYLNLYSTGGEAQFIEGDTFQTIIDLSHLAGFSPSENPVCEGINILTEGDTPKSEGHNLHKTVDRILSEMRLQFKKHGSRQKCYDLVVALLREGGKNASFYRQELNISRASIERYLRTLSQANIIELKGSARASGYYLTEYFQNMIIKN